MIARYRLERTRWLVLDVQDLSSGHLNLMREAAGHDPSRSRVNGNRIKPNPQDQA
jgi:hypothetical protein